MDMELLCASLNNKLHYQKNFIYYIDNSIYFIQIIHTHLYRLCLLMLTDIL